MWLSIRFQDILQGDKSVNIWNSCQFRWFLIMLEKATYYTAFISTLNHFDKNCEISIIKRQWEIPNLQSVSWINDSKLL